jgi:hypothetical protein
VHASREPLILHSPVAYPGSTLTHPAREMRVFKAAWCDRVGEGEGELEADFSSSMLPRVQKSASDLLKRVARV